MYGFILSRKYFLYIPSKNIIKEYKPRMKLNEKKIKYIIREKNKRRSSTEIAKEMKITTRYVNYIYKKYRDNGEYTIGKRKHRELNSKDIKTVKKIRYEYPMSGPERNGNTINAAYGLTSNFGPSWRLVVNLSNPAKSVGIIAI